MWQPIEFPHLYKRAGNKIRKWAIRINHNDNGTWLITTYGEYGGKQTDTVTPVKPMNIGKSNETDPYSQAILEAEAQVLAKREREGYYSAVDLGLVAPPSKQTLLIELPTERQTVSGFVLPMKAQTLQWKDGKPDVRFPVIAQPKFNGIRCMLSRDETGKPVLESKKGTAYKIQHLLGDVTRDKEALFGDGKEKWIYDGELYIHKQYLADIVSAARKPNLLTNSIVFIIFDVYTGYPCNQIKRIAYLKELSTTLSPITNLIVIRGTAIKDISALQAEYKFQLDSGYEGLILRKLDGIYEPGKRSRSLLKYKPLFDNEFEIIAVIESDKNPGKGVFVCRNDINNETFKVNPEGNNALKAQYLEDATLLIGKMLTVEYRERTPEPKCLPFHAVGKTVRDYE